MKLILLSGRANTGKTTILNMIINTLWSSDTFEHLISTDNFENLLCIAGKYNGNTIGIITMGEPTTEAFVKMSINKCLDYSCNIIIGATRTKGQVLNIYRDFASQHYASILQLNTIKISEK